jgi:hypothetical protein
MRIGFRLCFGIAAVLAACSVINKFDPLKDVEPDAGVAGSAGLAGTGGSVAGTDAGGSSGSGAGTAGAGNGGSSGTGTSGTGGEAGAPSEPITGGLIVVATRDMAVPPQYSLVMLDPTDATEIATTKINTIAKAKTTIHAVAYDSVSDKWFVFTGPLGKGVTGELLVGSMFTDGFHVEDSATNIPQPTDQIVVAMLNKRILYRSTTHTGSMAVDDGLTLLDTNASPPKAIGTMTIPVAQSVISMVGRPATGTVAGGRAFILHGNSGVPTNCSPEDGGAVQQDSCSFEYSAPQVLAADLGTLTPPTPAVVGVEDQNGSQPGLAVQPGNNGNIAAIIAPPLSSNNTTPSGSIYLYSSGTGARTTDPVLPFPMGMVSSVTASIAIAGFAIDNCYNIAMTGELANTKRIYAISLVAGGSTSSILPNSKNGTVGQLTFEPYTGTLIHNVNDLTNPTLEGFELHGTEMAPTFVQRGKGGAKPWSPPIGLVPLVVVTKMPASFATCPVLPP